MNKTVVIYESKYGSTKRYAQWIAETLSCPIFERKKFHPRNFSQYEIIIYGGGLYAGGVSGIKLLTRNSHLLSNKKIVLFTCGIANPDDPDNISNIKKSLQKVLTDEMFGHLALFHLRGRLDYSELSFVHKFMMSMLRKMLLKKDPQTLRDEDRQLLETYGRCVDFMDPDSIRPLVEYVASVPSAQAPLT